MKHFLIFRRTSHEVSQRCTGLPSLGIISLWSTAQYKDQGVEGEDIYLIDWIEPLLFPWQLPMEAAANDKALSCRVQSSLEKKA